MLSLNFNVFLKLKTDNELGPRTYVVRCLHEVNDVQGKLNSDTPKVLGWLVLLGLTAL